MKIILFDFEVFKHDTLLGAFILENDNIELYQTWDLDKIRDFYHKNKNFIWVGWNNSHYDNHILQAIVKEENPKKVSDEIIDDNKKKYLNIQLYNFDILSITRAFISLKQTEALQGKRISESEVDFNLNRPLTDDEKRLTEEYNFDDLEQTLENFLKVKPGFLMRLDTINEFNLPINSLSVTNTQIAEQVLKAEAIRGIENKVVKPKMYANLKIKNQKVRDFYLKEEFATGKKLKLDICGLEHTIGVGGIHAARKKYKAKEVLYFDVTGYYNLIMINYNLLPRSIPDEYKELYKDMYHEQLRLKKTNPKKRAVLKIILLSVFGAMINKYCKFYDPYQGRLVTMVGQMFLVDLLEKLEGKTEIVQSNTDGIMAVPLVGVEMEEILQILDEWQERTGFTLDVQKIYDLVQRDVNCYMYKKDSGKIVTRGGDIAEYSDPEYFSNAKEPSIIEKCIVEYFMKNRVPEEVVEEYMENLLEFQYIAKKGIFDGMELEEKYLVDTTITKVQSVNRVFASNDESCQRMLYKCRKEGKVKRAKTQNIPNNIILYNDEILSDEAKIHLMPKIDYQYYIDKAYDKIKDFIDVPVIKQLNVQLFPKKEDKSFPSLFLL